MVRLDLWHNKKKQTHIKATEEGKNNKNHGKKCKQWVHCHILSERKVKIRSKNKNMTFLFQIFECNITYICYNTLSMVCYTSDAKCKSFKAAHEFRYFKFQDKTKQRECLQSHRSYRKRNTFTTEHQ